MMIFKKYNSITNSYSTKFLDILKMYSLDEGLWYTQEKIHGANFAFYTQQGELKTAKRTSFFSAGSFFNCGELAVAMKDSIVALGDHLGAENEVIVYGELCGGAYPGFPQKRKAVQRDIKYSPELEFFMFDIMVNGEYLEFSKVIDLSWEFGIPLAPVLHKGTLEECLAYNNKFITKVPRILGYDDLEDNFCEGTVVRPEVTKFYGDARVILKNRNENFMEIKSISTPKVSTEVTEGLLEIIEAVGSCINRNRLDSVISKHGDDFLPKDFNKLLGLFLEDAYSDINKDREVTILDSLTKEERKIVSTEVTKLALPYIKEYLGLGPKVITNDASEASEMNGVNDGNGEVA